MAEIETEISIKGLTKSFGSQTVLEDITFDVPKGKIILILGPSGCKPLPTERCGDGACN